MTTLPARWWTNHHVSSSSTRKLDTGHWPMLAVVWAMSPAPKMKEASAASHDLYSVRCAYQFREIHSHPQDQVTESVHCSPVPSLWSAVCPLSTHTQLCIPIYLAFWFTEIAVAKLVAGSCWCNECNLSTFFLSSQRQSSFLVRMRDYIETTNRSIKSNKIIAFVKSNQNVAGNC